MEQPRKERSLHMLALMMDRSREYSVDDLCRELEVDRRTVYRYITTFNRAGFVVLTDHHRVRLARGTALERQLSELLYFSRDEAVTLYHAIDSVETDNALRRGLKEKLAALFGVKALSDKLMRLERDQSARRLMDAIARRRRAVLAGYSSASSATARDRLVEPFALSEDRKNVWAWEPESGKNKTFRISRIGRVDVLEEPWLDGRMHRVAFTDAFRMTSDDGSTLPARLLMDRRARNLLIEEYPSAEQDVTPADSPGQWVYEGRVSSYAGVGRFAAGLADCVTIETPALRRHVERFARRHILGLED